MSAIPMTKPSAGAMIPRGDLIVLGERAEAFTTLAPIQFLTQDPNFLRAMGGSGVIVGFATKTPEVEALFLNSIRKNTLLLLQEIDCCRSTLATVLSALENEDMSLLSNVMMMRDLLQKRLGYAQGSRSDGGGVGGGGGGSGGDGFVGISFNGGEVRFEGK